MFRSDKPYGENVTSSKHAASVQQACSKQAASKQAAFDGSSLTLINHMIHTPLSLPIQSNVDLLIVYFFKHLKEDYSLLAMAYFK